MPSPARLRQQGALISSSLLCLTALVGATSTAAQDYSAAYATFVPGEATNADTVDYDVWDEAVKNIVVSMGPSLRQTAGRPPDSYGTRRVYGHTSRYRLEGSRVTFSFLDDEIIGNIARFRKELQAVSDRVDIQSLSRNEQLAYWINLHNVAIIEKISSEWPVRQPRSLELNGVPLDDAKFINVEGVKLSPRDIREKIVFANWNDPMVIYGFWRGEIGGPSIQREAYSGQNVRRLLDRSAREFVNSLRGTQKRGDTLEVSEVYEEAAPFFFPNFEDDLRAHLDEYAQEDVAAILANTVKIQATINEYDIADLAGGAREPSYSFIETAGGRAQTFRIPRSMGALLAQREEKFRRLIKEGRTGTVTVGTINLPGEENANEVQ